MTHGVIPFNFVRYIFFQDVGPIFVFHRSITLFRLVGRILDHHSVFMDQLKLCVRDWPNGKSIASVFQHFLSSEAIIVVYREFIGIFEASMASIDAIVRFNAEIHHELDACLMRSTSRLPLYGLAIKPIQRFPHYICFLKVNLQHAPCVPQISAFVL